MEALVDGMAGTDHAASQGSPTQDAWSMPERCLKERKSMLRTELLAARVRQSVADRKAAGGALRDVILGLPETGMAGTIAAYLSVGTEPQTAGLVFALWKRGSYVLLPVLRPDYDLDWASYEGPESLAEGPRGLLEPTAPRRGDHERRPDHRSGTGGRPARQPARPRRRLLRPGAGQGRSRGADGRTALRRRTARRGARRAA